MKTLNTTFAVAVVAMLTLLISFGCADVSVDPEVSVNGSGLIGDTKVKAHESFSQIVNLTNQTSLKVEGINGSISVESVFGTNQVSISGEKIVSSDTYQDANSHLKDIALKIDELTNELLVKTLQPQYSNGRSYQVNYTITIPSNLSITIDNVNGSIQLEIPQTTSANFSASLVNGSISLQNLILHNKVVTSKSLMGTLGNGQGTISLRTTNGNINVLGF
ncbi:MAG: DUF4097 family beta strand repeat protein [Ignavibacteriaceae bacterium]|nr:DUF4097 family beta strand repeat protein [Ignavibacteriaceae bacterium]